MYTSWRDHSSQLGGLNVNTTQGQDIPQLFQTTNDTATSANVSGNATVTASLQEEELNVGFVYTELVLDLLDCYRTIIAVLVEMAQISATDRMEKYTSPLALPIEITFASPVPSRTAPPFFETQWLIRTMAVIPYQMMRKGGFYAALMSVEIDGVKVADGFLGEHDDKIGTSAGGANVSVS